MNRSSPLINIVTLCCALGMIVAYAFLPSFSLPGSSGAIDHLGAGWRGGQSILILISATGAGLMTLWGMFVPRHRGIASIGVAVAGMVGWAYFALAIANELARGGTFATLFFFRGSGFWIAFIAMLEMVVQMFVSRQSDPRVSLPDNPPLRAWFAKIFVLAAALLVSISLLVSVIQQPANVQCITIDPTGRQIGSSFACLPDRERNYLGGSGFVTLFGGIYFAALILSRPNPGVMAANRAQKAG